MINTKTLTDDDFTLSETAKGKMAELVGSIEDEVVGVRVYATPGGCSGISFGMSFTDQVTANDLARDYGDFKVIVDDGTINYLKGAEIDFLDRGNGDASFVFNNIQPVVDAGCNTCGSQSGCA